MTSIFCFLRMFHKDTWQSCSCLLQGSYPITSTQMGATAGLDQTPTVLGKHDLNGLNRCQEGLDLICQVPSTLSERFAVSQGAVSSFRDHCTFLRLWKYLSIKQKPDTVGQSQVKSGIFGQADHHAESGAFRHLQAKIAHFQILSETYKTVQALPDKIGAMICMTCLEIKNQETQALNGMPLHLQYHVINSPKILERVLEVRTENMHHVIPCPDSGRKQPNQGKKSDPQLLQIIPDMYFYVITFFAHYGKEFGKTSFSEIAKPRVWKPETPVFQKLPPTLPPPKPPPKHPKNHPPLVWECKGAHRKVERSAGASLGGREGGGVWAGWGWQFMKTRVFQTWGLAISEFQVSSVKDLLVCQDS